MGEIPGNTLETIVGQWLVFLTESDFLCDLTTAEWTGGEVQSAAPANADVAARQKDDITLKNKRT